MNIDQAIARLYQLPLGEFTPARNALAKQVRGADAARVRTLQKPTVPAWAVNQLYWRERPLYDQVIEAAERLRTAHRSLLAGKTVDLHEAEAAHRDAVRTAAKRTRELVSEAGESASPANLTAIGETLEALPVSGETAGLLTRPLKRMGFEALSGVPSRPAGTPPARNLSLVSSRDRAKPPAKPEISPARQREIDELETRLRTAQTEERQLHAEIERGRRELERAEREEARARQELADSAEKLKEVRAAQAAREKARDAAEREQKKLEERLEKVQSSKFKVQS
jgi:hypothetical protein